MIDIPILTAKGDHLHQLEESRLRINNDTPNTEKMCSLDHKISPHYLDSLVKAALTWFHCLRYR